MLGEAAAAALWLGGGSSARFGAVAGTQTDCGPAGGGLGAGAFVGAPTACGGEFGGRLDVGAERRVCWCGVAMAPGGVSCGPGQGQSRVGSGPAPPCRESLCRIRGCQCPLPIAAGGRLLL